MATQASIEAARKYALSHMGRAAPVKPRASPLATAADGAIVKAKQRGRTALTPEQKTAAEGIERAEAMRLFSHVLTPIMLGIVTEGLDNEAKEQDAIRIAAFVTDNPGTEVDSDLSLALHVPVNSMPVGSGGLHDKMVARYLRDHATALDAFNAAHPKQQCSEKEWTRLLYVACNVLSSATYGGAKPGAGITITRPVPVSPESPPAVVESPADEASPAPKGRKGR